jgi:hypothetical protein
MANELENLSDHFTQAEAEFSVYALRNGIDNTIPDGLRQNAVDLCNEILEPLRDEVGPIHLDSLFRCDEVNTGVGGQESSQHKLAQAADIIVRKKTPAQICAKIVELSLPFDQLIEEFGWIHVSHSVHNRRQKLRARRVSLLNGKSKIVYDPVESWK